VEDLDKKAPLKNQDEEDIDLTEEIIVP